MGAAPRLGAWDDVVVGDLELDSLGGDFFKNFAGAFHELYGSER